MPGVAEPGRPSASDVTLDTTLYLPAVGGRAPAVVLAHGFGGSKDSVADDARDLAGRGYVVLTYSARGFGAQHRADRPGRPALRGRRPPTLIDRLAARRDVCRTRPGDPRVGVAGGSYGGALALLGAAYDRRIDAIAPQITWNSLTAALFPRPAGPVDRARTAGGDPAAGDAGVYKRLWAGLFFGVGSAPAGGLALSAAGDGAPAPPGAGAGSTLPPSSQALTCGRFRADICAAYQPPPPPARSRRRSRRSSTAAARPACSTGSRRRRCWSRARRTRCSGSARPTPTPAASPRTAPRSRSSGTPAATTAARPTQSPPSSRAGRRLVRLLPAKHTGTTGAPASSFPAPTGLQRSGTRSADGGSRPGRRPLPRAGRAARATPDGAAAAGRRSRSSPRPAAPPARSPRCPASASLGRSALGGQHGRHPRASSRAFTSRPLDRAARRRRRAPRGRRLAVSSPAGAATLFAKLYDVAPTGGSTLPAGLVAPAGAHRAAADPAAPTRVAVTLPAIDHRFERRPHAAARRLHHRPGVRAAGRRRRLHGRPGAGRRPRRPPVAGRCRATPASARWWVLLGAARRRWRCSAGGVARAWGRRARPSGPSPSRTARTSRCASRA